MSNFLQFCVVGALAALAAAPAHAARYYVHPTLGNDLNPGDDWSVPLRTLDEALTRAGSTPLISDEIWVAQGTYRPTFRFPLGSTDPRHATFSIPPQTQVFGGFEGPGVNFPSGEIDLTQRNPEVNITILDGDIDAGGNPNPDGLIGNNCYHVVRFRVIDNYQNQTKLSGFTVQNGNANAANSPFDPDHVYDAFGGGILTVSESVPPGPGGGDQLNYGPFINRCRIINNRARDAGGGAYNFSMLRSYFTNCRFEGNSAAASDGEGGAVFLKEKAGASFQNCVFYMNTSSGVGGAISIDGHGGTVYISNCTFSGNTATGIDIGGTMRYGHSAFTHGPIAGVRNSISWANSGAD